MLYFKGESMPPVRKFDRDTIIAHSLELILKEGNENFNARSLASYLGSSVQPIFHYFLNMEELNQEIYKAIFKKYSDLMIEASLESEDSYKKIGRAYIKFTRDYKEFFKIIFMQKTDLNTDNFMASGVPIDDIIEAGRRLTGLSFEEQKEFHKKVWIFTHGIACLVNTETVNLSDKEVDNLLTDTVRDMLIGYKKGIGNEKSN